MFAVTVTFAIHPNHWDQFLLAMHDNAATSLAQEPDCVQFDVATDPDHPHEVFLYELYSDAAAFQTHLSSAHFKQFDQAVAPMIAAKNIRTYREISQ